MLASQANSSSIRTGNSPKRPDRIGDLVFAQNGTVDAASVHGVFFDLQRRDSSQKLR
jgi:hypothetical protein